MVDNQKQKKCPKVISVSNKVGKTKFLAKSNILTRN